MAVQIALSDAEREELTRWSAGAVSQALAVRAKMVLACADGMPNARVAEVFGVSDMTVATWRSRFAQGGWTRCGTRGARDDRKRGLCSAMPSVRN
jgi:hypothetical protein